ncbi:MAG: hypothetical protein K2Q20_10745, partial [Phycisphaerales bacterium]|nr:hypothetical protein [Phycisphaerales bacterium]
FEDLTYMLNAYSAQGPFGAPVAGLTTMDAFQTSLYPGPALSSATVLSLGVYTLNISPSAPIGSTVSLAAIPSFAAVYTSQSGSIANGATGQSGSVGLSVVPAPAVALPLGVGAFAFGKRRRR